MSLRTGSMMLRQRKHRSTAQQLEKSALRRKNIILAQGYMNMTLALMPSGKRRSPLCM
jgi:hypothetical protein